ncbi:MAG: threonine/serine dehydratase [Labilithrix sp.]|nr:threonine/serine dehydratase [Labilithrix sp.]
MTETTDTSFLVPELFSSARETIAPHVVVTPVTRIGARGGLHLKLECLQVSGSFKARGALNKVLSLAEEDLRRGIVTASGGNHGLAVAYAGSVLRVSTVVYLPRRTPDAKAKRIEAWGARVVRAGDVWDDAHAAALEHAARETQTYIHPFADPAVIAGQGTIALEAFEQIPEVDLFVVAIGGGGLVAGVAAAAKLLRPSTRIIGVEPVGAPTLRESLRAGEVIELASIETAAGTLAPRRSDPLNFAIIRETVDDIVLVSDEEMKSAARFLLAELGIGAELSGAAALAAMLSGKADLGGAKRPCVLVCGAGSDGLG